MNDQLPASPAALVDGGLAAVAGALAAVQAAEVACIDTACNAATSHRDECDCRCEGAGHGLDRQAQEARGREAWRARTDVDRRTGFTRAMLANLPADEPDLAPRQVAAYAIHLDEDEVW